MADENQNPEEVTTEEIQDIAKSVPAADDYPEGQAEELEDSLEHENAMDKAAVAGLKATEEASDSTVAKVWDKGVSGIVEGIESLGRKTHDPEEALAHHHNSDVTRFAGREYPIPIYTSVFIVLAIVTLFEVFLAEVIETDIRIIPLLALSIFKATLVVYYYMHLNIDSRIFAVILLLALGIAGLSAAFLVSVPSFGY